MSRERVESNHAPLSFAQQRLWFLDQLEPNSPLYNVPAVARVTGPLDTEILRRALQAIIARHETLRTRIASIDDVPSQQIFARMDPDLRMVDVQGQADPDRQAFKQVQDEIRKPFGIRTDSLLRTLVVQIAPQEYLVAVTMHHIISDEWSLRIFFRELKEIYEALAQGRSPTLPELALQYADCVVAQRERMAAQPLEKQLSYWKNKLTGSPLPIELSTDHPRSSAPTFCGRTLELLLPPQTGEALRALAVAEGVTLFMLLLAALKALVYRYTQQEDLIIATPIAGRTEVETEDLIGLFVNTLALRTGISGVMTFRELLKQVRETTLDAYANQELPFDKLVEELQPERSFDHLPFTHLMFVFQHDPLDQLRIADLEWRFEEIEHETAKFELTLFAQNTAAGLRIRAEYNSDLFEAATIERLLKHFQILLAGIAANPGRKIGALPLLTEEEQHQLLVDWNRTSTAYPRNLSVPAVFEKQVRQRLCARAVTFGQQTLNYRELNARANQLAHFLRNLGVGPDVPVAICVQRSIEMVVGLLAVLKAGGAYVPLDPTYPTRRLEFMLTDSRAQVLLTQQRLLSRLPGHAPKVICLDADWDRIARESRRNLACTAGPLNLAYIMYTSGSTGQPKGVAIPHRAINRLVLGTNYIQLHNSDRLAQIANISFDAATFEIWGALLNGGQLIGISADAALSPHEFARELGEQGVTALFLTAALFNQLASETPAALAGIRTVIAGGEALDPKWTRTVLKQGPPQRLLNGYGPTENTTFSCCHWITEVPAGATNVPIGRPISNTTVYLLDRELNPVPIGVPGDLYVGGDGLARGYWNQPQLTDERFLPNPFNPDAGKIYRTGDLARYRPDGSIEFLGRKDSQVKIRGFRVELGEIEAGLGEHRGVRECAVMVGGRETGHQRLVAYFIPTHGFSPTSAELRQFLAEKLPRHMIPATFVKLSAFPLTVNGKLDRRALPVPEAAHLEPGNSFVPPRDNIETQLIRIWEEVLEVRPIGIEDRFFDLGGHSLLAVRLMSQIEKAFGRHLRLATIFQAPTISQLAAILREERGEETVSTRASSVVEIQTRGARPPLFFVHGAGGGMFWGYVNLSRHLGCDQPVYGFRSRGLDGEKEFGRLEDMAAQYVTDMRSVQPSGPYYLGGYCFGGNVAYEMARQLIAQGEEVRLLALLNCAPPNSSYSRPTWSPMWFGRFLRNVLYWFTYCRRWTPVQRRDFFRWKLTMLRKNLASRAGISSDPACRLEVENMVDLSSFSVEQQKLWETHIRAQFEYHPQPFPGRIHLFRSPGHPICCSFDPNYGWGELARGGVEVRVVPAVHEKILEEPFVEVVAAELEKTLAEDKTTEVTSPPPPSFTQEEALDDRGPIDSPLSFSQQRLWMLYQLEPGNPAYHQVAAFVIEGRLHPDDLATALKSLVERHTLLQTTFPSENGRPVVRRSSQIIRLQQINAPLPAGAELHQALGENALEEKRRPFALGSDLPLRARLVDFGSNRQGLVLVLHEIAGDADSLTFLARELCSIYEECHSKKGVPLRGANFEYVTFARTQRAQCDAGAWTGAVEFWKQELAGAPALLEFPVDHPRPAQQSYRATSVTRVLPAELQQAIRKVANPWGDNGADLLLATVNLLIKRYVRQDEVIVALPIRSSDPLIPSDAIGNFENFLLLRTDLSGDPSFAEFLERIRLHHQQIRQHEVPFEKLLETLIPNRDQSHHPLAQVSFRYRNWKAPSPLRMGKARSLSLDLEPDTTRFDLSFEFLDVGEQAMLRVVYAKDLFSKTTISRLLGHWERLLEGITALPQSRLSAVPMLLAEEERTLLSEWNDTARDYPKNKSLIDLFDEQAWRTPDATALVCDHIRLSYRELQARSRLIAEHVRIRMNPFFESQSRAVDLNGGQPLIGICLHRSWQMIAAILASLRLGAAYVPMDPAYPRDRLAFVARDAGLSVLLTQQDLLGSLPHSEAEVISVDEVAWNSTPSEVPKEGTKPKPEDLAYVIYTSGSTGQPKGVALEHRSAVAFVHWARSVFADEELDGVLASTSICFDLSIFEMFVPLCWGGKVILAENCLALPKLPAAGEVRMVNTVPSAIRELLRAKGLPVSVRVVNLAGEPLPTALVEQIYRAGSVEKVYDLYGPTETTTYSTYTLRQPGHPPSIGRPLTNEHVYLLDGSRSLVPIGVPGELHIGGDGLAREYLNRPELTRERFIPHPFRPGARLYKTGDLARWREDGTLEFLGRIDHQVKIRGFRIELGEVETILKKQPGVSEAVAVAREDTPGDKRLVAYVVAANPSANSAAPSSDALRAGLRESLPEYMLPSFFIFLPALPLTPNGKVDRKALPAPEQQARSAEQAQVEPRTLLEQQFAAAWREVLQLERVSIYDSFFDAGGHSLLGFQFLSRIREITKVDIPLSALFDHPTIAELAQGVAEGRWEKTQAALPALEKFSAEGDLPVSFVQERLWFLDQLNPESDAYNVAMALRLSGSLNPVFLQSALDGLVQRHQELRTNFRSTNGNVLQFVHQERRLTIQPIQLEHGDLQQLLNAEARKPFDLEHDALIRVILARVGTEQALLIVLHHIISDGWSVAILLRELAHSYNALVHSKPATLPELRFQYADYAHWQRRWLAGPVLDQELKYWKEKLAGAPPRLDLPADNSDDSGHAAGCAQIELPLELSERIADLGRAEHTTPFMVLMTALATTLHKWTGQNDLVIGTVVAGRHRQELENVIGCFMNFLPIRIQISDGQTSMELLSRVRSGILEAQAHQDCPFEKMVEAINPERKLNQNPLYNVGFLLQNYPAQIFETDGVHVSPMPIQLSDALLDLRFEAEQAPGGLRLKCEYRKSLFEPGTVEQLLASFHEILRTLLFDPQTRVDEMKITEGLQSAVEDRGRRQQTIAIAGTFTVEPLEESLRYWQKYLGWSGPITFAPYNQLFQQLLDPGSALSTNRNGLNVVLLRLEDWQHKTDGDGTRDFAGTDNIQRSANDLVLALESATVRCSAPFLVCICPPSPRILSDSDAAKHLRSIEKSLSVQLEDIDGVHVVRQEDLSRWYPVPEYDNPQGEELGHVPYTPRFFTALATLIARKWHALNRPPYKVIVLDCDHTLWNGVCGEDGPTGIRLDSPFVALQTFMRNQLTAGMLLCLCSKNNEEDVWQVFEHANGMLLRPEHFVGCRLNWLPKSENLKALASELKLGLDSFIFVDDNPVECAAVEAELPQVLTLQLPESPEFIPSFLEHCWAFDHLKLTDEDHQRTDWYRQGRQRDQFRSQAVTLADFLDGLELKVRIAPVTSAQFPRVAQLTQRTNQFNFSTRRRSETELQALARDAEILAVHARDRFGDYGLVGTLIYRRNNGVLEIDTFLLSCRVLGRGVEHQMLAHLGQVALEARAAWVDAHFVKTPKNKPALTFLESIDESVPQPLPGGCNFRFPARAAAETRFIAGNLDSNASDMPGAVPNQRPNESSSLDIVPRRGFTRYRQLALETADIEKVHAAIENKAVRRQVRSNGYLPPGTELEKALCALWQELLRVDRVGIRDNFFELGGHSLLAVRLFAELEKLTQRKLPLVTLFQAPTIEELSHLLGREPTRNGDSLLVPIQPHGSRPPLFLVHGAGGDVLWGYANLSCHLPADQPVYGLKSRGQVGLPEYGSLEEMAAAYLREVQSFQKQGPYYLGGYCFGGNVAYEMARQLVARGETVGLVALLDSAPANAGYETVTWWRPGYVLRFSRNLGYWLADFARLSSRDRVRFVLRKTRAAARKVWRRTTRARSHADVDLEDVIDPRLFPAHELKLWQIHLRALTEHIQQPYSGPVVLFRTRGQPLLCSFEEDFCWGRLAQGGITVKPVPGSHENVFVEPHVRQLAQELTACLTPMHSNGHIKPATGPEEFAS